MSRRDDEGTVLLLTIFLGLVLVAVVVTVVDASAVFLARRALSAEADAAALAAAQRVDWAAYYAGSGDLLPLDGDADLTPYLRPGTVLADVTTDGETVTVTLERDVVLPLAPPGWDRRVTVTAAAAAELSRHR